MAVAFRAATTAQNSAGTASLTINVPAGTTNGDVLLLFGTNSAPDSYTTPTGWTPLDNPIVGTTGESQLFIRVASSEPASYALTKASASFASCAVMACYSGASGTPRDHTSANTATAVTTAAPTALTGVTATDMAVHFYGVDESATSTTNLALTPPGGAWNTRANVTAAKGGVTQFGAAIAVIDQLGSSATPSTTSNANSGWPICSVALTLPTQTVSPTGIASAETFGAGTVVLGPAPPPASGPLRRFDPIEKVVRNDRRSLADTTSTVLSRLSSHTHAYVPLATATTKGDLLVATASGTIVRHGVGTNGQVLIADSAQTDGVRWEFQSIPVFATTAARDTAITVPFAGQVVFITADAMLYRYTGAAWLAFLATGTTAHEARYEQTSGQSVPNATDTKLQFPTAVTTTSDVTASGTGNTDFLLNRAGVWLQTASIRYLAGTTGERHLALATGTTVGTLSARIAVQSTFPGAAAGSVAVATVYRAAAGTSIFAATWQNNGGALALETAFGSTNHISLTWLRPL